MGKELSLQKFQRNIEESNMNLLSKASKSMTVAASVLLTVGLLSACGTTGIEATQMSPNASVEAVNTTQEGTPSQILSASAWETTGATDAAGNAVALTDANVSNFVGNAYFKADGTFTMFTLDDAPKIHGDWSVSADGTSRHIVSRDDAGKELLSRDTDIVTLNSEEFTYRVFPEQDKKDVYYDIIHTPTSHAEPAV
ncbi:DUF4822 domain-containing protein [Arthrobacter psychrolactophilus]